MHVERNIYIIFSLTILLFAYLYVISQSHIQHSTNRSKQHTNFVFFRVIPRWSYIVRRIYVMLIKFSSMKSIAITTLHRLNQSQQECVCLSGWLCWCFFAVDFWKWSPFLRFITLKYLAMLFAVSAFTFTILCIRVPFFSVAFQFQ